MFKIILVILSLNLVFISASMESNEKISELTFLADKNKDPWDWKKETDFPLFNNDTDHFDGTKGYNSSSKKLADFECYREPKSKIINLEGKLKFNSRYSFSEMTNEMVAGFKLDLTLKDGQKIGKEIDAKDPAKDGKLHIPFDINIGLHLNFTDYFAQSEMSSSMFYYVVHYRKRIITYPLLFKNAINEEVKELLDSNQFDFEKFTEYCGDEIVSNLKEGGIIIVQVMVNFNSKYNKQIFDAGFKVGLGEFLNLGADLKNTMTKLNIGGKVSVMGVQKGGDPSRFGKLFPDNKSNECAGVVDPDVKISGGRQEALRKCMEFVNKVSDYIREDFPNQFSNKTNYESFYPVSIETRKMNMIR